MARQQRRTDVEERIRSAIEFLLSDYGSRKRVSLAIGKKRGWATEYITGKQKKITVDELAALAPLIGLDVASLMSGVTPSGLPIEMAKQIVQLTTSWPLVDAAERTVYLAMVLRAVGRTPASASGESVVQSKPAKAMKARRVHGKRRAT